MQCAVVEFNVLFSLEMLLQNVFKELKIEFCRRYIVEKWLDTGEAAPKIVDILLVLLILCNSPEEVGIFVVIAGYGTLCPITDHHCAEVLGYPSNGLYGVRTGRT